MSGNGAPRVERDGDVVRITMVRAAKRNALSREHLTQLLAAVTEAGSSDATGIVLAAEGPVFSAGHDFGDVHARDEESVRLLLELCTMLMKTIQSVPRGGLGGLQGLPPGAGGRLVPCSSLVWASWH